MWEFDRLVPFLHDAGIATLQLDLFGHGYSARPNTRYTLGLFARQINETIAALSLGYPEYVLGHSLGAAVAVHLQLQSQFAKRAMILAAPLVNFMANMPAGRLLTYPLVGELLVPGFVIPMLKRRRANRYGNIEDGRFVDYFNRQIEQPGFNQALLSLFRTGTLGDQTALYRAAAEHLPATLIVRGDEDNIVTSDQVDAMRNVLPVARYTEIPGTGHPFMLTHPARAAQPMVDFLAAH